MDKLNQWLGILANVGVITGIVFLAVELNQNNRLMESEARMKQGESAQEAWREIYQNPGTAELFAKFQNNEPLSDAESIRLEAYQRRQILSLQFQFEEYRNGMLDQINLTAWRRLYSGVGGRPPLNEVWGNIKISMFPEFVEFFDENVVQYSQ